MKFNFAFFPHQNFNITQTGKSCRLDFRNQFQEKFFGEKSNFEILRGKKTKFVSIICLFVKYFNLTNKQIELLSKKFFYYLNLYYQKGFIDV